MPQSLHIFIWICWGLQTLTWLLSEYDLGTKLDYRYYSPNNRYDIKSVIDIQVSLSSSLIFISIRVYYPPILFCTLIITLFHCHCQHRLHFSTFSYIVGAKHSKLAVFHTFFLWSEQVPTCKCLAYNPLISWSVCEVFRYKTRWPLHRSDNLQRMVHHNQVRWDIIRFNSSPLLYP